MSVSYYAHTVVGVRLDAEDFRKRTLEPPCDHKIIAGNKFCSECGVSTKPVEKFESILPNDKYDAEEPEFAHLNIPKGMIFYRWDGYENNEEVDFLYVGYGDSTDYNNKHKFIQLSDDMRIKPDGLNKFINAKEEVQKFLEPLGLWKPNQFGIWCFAVVS